MSTTGRRRRPRITRKKRDAARHGGLAHIDRHVDEIDDFAGLMIYGRSCVEVRPSVVVFGDSAEDDLPFRMSRKRDIVLHNCPR